MKALDGFPGVRVGMVTEDGTEYLRLEFDSEEALDGLSTYLHETVDPDCTMLMLPLEGGEPVLP